MNVTQQITNFLGGVSQASDTQKDPNQVDDIINGYTDSTYGLLKRPGSQWLYDLDISNPFTYKWFAINDSSLPFYGCIGNGTLRLWSSQTGQEQTILYLDSSDTYCATPAGVEAWKQFKLVTTEKGTIVVNKEVTVAASSDKTPGTLTGTVANFDGLPTDAAVDDIYLITNTDSEFDDYYVQWDGNYWNEVAEPGISLGLNNTTMPHFLVRTGGSNWALSPVNYANRLVGSAKSSPHPSFVGLKINNAFTYLNRIGFLASSNVVMSQPLVPDNTAVGQTNPINFYINSAFVSSDADPIDINASSIKQVQLTSVSPGRQGLVVFGDVEQFLLYSEQGIITPNTATIRSISQWERQSDIDPVELNTEYYFINGQFPLNQHARVIKMRTRGLEEDPIVTDISKDVSEWIPSNAYQLVSSTQEQFVSLTNRESNEIYFYRSFTLDGELVMRNWFKWEFDFNIVSYDVINGNMYIIGECDNAVFSCFLVLNNAPTNKVLSNTTLQPATPVLPVKPNIDVYSRPIDGGVKYKNGRTEIQMPANFPILTNASPVVLLAENNMPRSLQYENIQAGFGFPVEWRGDVQRFVTNTSADRTADAERMVLGYLFRYQIDLPTLYYRAGDKTDFSARLNISRCKFECSAGLQGSLSFQVRSDGYPDYDATFEVTDADQYDADNLPLIKTRVFEVPIHKQNRYYTMSIVSDSPFPIALNTMTWEGDYSPRFYRRA